MKCDIVIVIWNQLQMTKNCLKELILKTKAPYRLILIDNASNKETANYLRDFTSLHKDKVKLIRNENNLGFVKAANQGLRIREADFVCLLNNDTLVTEDWLKELIFVASNNPEIGLINPSSNTLGQKTSVKNIDSYAKNLKRHHGDFEEMAQVSGFCMFIKEDVIEEIGILDEVYGIGYFEDTDYSRRAQKAGFKNVRSSASYVYHHENISFLRFKKSNEIFCKNQKIFYNRWGRPKRIFIEARYGFKEEEVVKILTLARNANWVIIVKEGNVNIKILKHSNIKILSYRKPLFILKSFFKILKKIKKRYDILVIQSQFLKRIMIPLKVIHKAEVFSLSDIGSLKL